MGLKYFWGAMEFDSDTHESLIKKLGGIASIQMKLEENLLFGERYYLEHILFIQGQFDSMKENQHGN